MKNQNQTGLKIFKPKINLNHNIYIVYVIYRYSSDLLGLRMCSDMCHSDVQIKRSELC